VGDVCLQDVSRRIEKRRQKEKKRQRERDREREREKRREKAYRLFIFYVCIYEALGA